MGWHAAPDGNFLLQCCSLLAYGHRATARRVCAVDLCLYAAPPAIWTSRTVKCCAELNMFTLHTAVLVSSRASFSCRENVDSSPEGCPQRCDSRFWKTLVSSRPQIHNGEQRFGRISATPRGQDSIMHHPLKVTSPVRFRCSPGVMHFEKAHSSHQLHTRNRRSRIPGRLSLKVRCPEACFAGSPSVFPLGQCAICGADAGCLQAAGAQQKT